MTKYVAYANIIDVKQEKQKMAEEKFDDPSVTLDDAHALRVLLHTVRGISSVSAPPALEMVYEEELF